MATQAPTPVDREVTIRYDDKKDKLICYPEKLDDVDREAEVTWSCDDGSVEEWVVFFASGAAVNPISVSGQGTVKNKVKVDEHATGHRKVPPEGAPSNWKDKLRIKYCVAATVKIDGVTKLKECDPELIVKPG